MKRWFRKLFHPTCLTIDYDPCVIVGYKVNGIQYALGCNLNDFPPERRAGALKMMFNIVFKKLEDDKLIPLELNH